MSLTKALDCVWRECSFDAVNFMDFDEEIGMGLVGYKEDGELLCAITYSLEDLKNDNVN
jgi:hypothetical protein